MKTSLKFTLILTFFTITLFAQTDSTYNLNINRIDFPIRWNGILGASYKDNATSTIKFDSIHVIWSAGFLLSGYSNGNLWSNAVASAARIEDYISGPVGGEATPLFVLKSSDIDFGDSWQNWINAVELGAYFYDGNGDGIYNPVDLNSNGVWDPNEDKPDLLGDETIWCVYNDGLPSADRLYTDINPQGIEIRQTVWAVADEGDEGNVIYVRYSILNTGTVAQTLESVYFGSWSDTDIGGYLDDLGGTDIELNSAFVYNDSSDTVLGFNSLAHFMSLMQRPWQAVDDPNSLAFNNLGGVLGTDTIYGAVNLKMTSSNQILKYVPEHTDPDSSYMARNLLKGLTSLSGEIIDPCNWDYGVVNGVDCEEIPLYYIYSGNPVTNYGWINNNPTDTRMLANTGPFTLTVNEPKDIIVTHVIARDADYLSSFTETKRIVNSICNKFITDIEKADEITIVKDYFLSQNYPNPFNPSTTIKYAIPTVETGHATSVQLKVYDVLGREVATLVNEHQQSGIYEVEFNAGNLVSGIYFYEIAAGKYRKTNKMLLIK